MNRRNFLSTSAAGLGAGLGHYASAFEDKKPRVGLIGTGWYGKCDLLRLIQVAPVDVVSLCDVDQHMLAEAADLVSQRQVSKKKPRLFGDYRQMLAEKDLDIVLIGTPDHWHALTAIEAMKVGADVYVQKPISVDVLEGKAMLDAARKYNRVVQVGTQRRSTPHLIDARDKVVKPGLLGAIGQVDIYCYYQMRYNDDPKPIPVPDFFDYDMWTGPAPMRVYDKLPHRRWWRTFTEYGNGIVGDMCVHMLDMVRWMLDLGWPKSVSSSGGILVQKKGKSNIADTQTATFDYEKFPIVWNHRTWGSPADADYPWGATIYGEKGTLKLSVNKFEFFPAGKKTATIKGEPLFEYEKYPEDKTEKDLEQHVASAIRVHMRDFLKAIGERGKPVADIEQGYISTATCILANLAMKTGRTLQWDPVKTQIVGDDEANKLLKRPYRGPWEHPAG